MRKRSGIVTDDPLKGMPVGQRLEIRCMLCHPPIALGAGSIEEWDHYGGLLFAVGFGDAQKFNIEGSAILVAPGVALSARHVIKPHLDAILAGDTGIMLMSVSPHGLDLHRIEQVVIDETDVCILRTSLASDLPPSGDIMCATMTTRLPKVGERIFLAGYRAQEIEPVAGGFAAETRIAVGEVTAIYMHGRDSVILPHPCIEVKTLTLGGMSGGPAFDEGGKVVGILTSSIEDPDGPSYVSMLWPALTNKIETVWPNGIIQCPYNLSELGRIIPILERPDAVNRDATGKWRYEPWS